eukprot:CAMPEP_0115866652 /NCGR_PEP_ID=MMETSP0287-20121206/20361_1 /TAXON_ID=412157 /ORGANISM="Chrysochromulina rotalis, Strain UIO044" /LENGTH=129 /DNA_ID=CAMNT_0003321229 /DNA_START=24 /DNA_END=414 /DNA_ORIENTATION=+
MLRAASSRVLLARAAAMPPTARRLTPRPQTTSERWLCAAQSNHVFEQLPANWRKLDYPTLEVFDTTELKSLQKLLAQERERVTELRASAKEQQRKVLRVDCDLDLKRIAKIETWVDAACKEAEDNGETT